MHKVYICTGCLANNTNLCVGEGCHSVYMMFGITPTPQANASWYWLMGDFYTWYYFGKPSAGYEHGHVVGGLYMFAKAFELDVEKVRAALNNLPLTQV